MRAYCLVMAKRYQSDNMLAQLNMLKAERTDILVVDPIGWRKWNALLVLDTLMKVC